MNKRITVRSEIFVGLKSQRVPRIEFYISLDCGNFGHLWPSSGLEEWSIQNYYFLSGQEQKKI